MSDYLRDKYIPYRTIGGTELEELNSDIETILKNAKASDETLHIEYLIRYDGIGVIRKKYEEIKKCFDIAKTIERIAINLKNSQSSLLKGKNIEIRFDSFNSSNCFLRVSDDDEAWVEKQFKSLVARIDKFKNKNSIVHSSVATLAIQLCGVLSGLFLSLISAKLLSASIEFQHSFYIFFIGIFLVFSNLWTYILQSINNLRIKVWPFVSFNKKPLGIVGQSFVGLIITSTVFFLAKWSICILRGASGIITK